MNLNHAFDFTGKVAVVSGGSGVLCGALARALGEQGAAVVVVGHTHMDRAQGVVDEIAAQGGQAVAVQANVLDKESLRDLAELTLDRFGHIDILINGAGGAKKEATTSQELSFADRPLTRSVAYSAAKAATVNFTRWLAVHMSQEYSPRIRVNALMPGFFLTEQNRFLLLNEGGELTERGQRIISHTPMARFGQPEDLVGPALMLLSDAAGFVHGTTMVVDGGLSAYGGV
jgi:NAD(P)-dependent dehydrogenase (short-subunit alcohol dehydrogenase family)